MNVKAMARKVREWLSEPTQATRGTAIGIWTVVVGTCFGGVFGVNEAISRVGQEANQRAVDRCVTRAESRTAVRGVFLDLYTKVAEASPSTDTQEFVDEARRSLDELYPPIDLSTCLTDDQLENTP